VILPVTGTALVPVGNEIKYLQHRYKGRQTLPTRPRLGDHLAI